PGFPGARLHDPVGPITRGHVVQVRQELLGPQPVARLHGAGSVASVRNSPYSQARAAAQSRVTVRRVIPSAAAVSSAVNPPNTRHSTTCAARGSASFR